LWIGVLIDLLTAILRLISFFGQILSFLSVDDNKKGYRAGLATLTAFSV